MCTSYYFLLLLIPTALAGVFNVKDFGAVGDGRANDTPAVRAAAAALAAAAPGPSTLLFPAGVFLTGPFNITTDDVTLLVEGTILGSTSNADFVLVAPLPWYGGGNDYQQSGAPEWMSIVRSWGASRLTITGGGTIDGSGSAWWPCAGKAAAPCAGFSRPHLLMLVGGDQLLITNVTIQNSPAWTLHISNFTRAHVHHITVLNPPSTGPNPSKNADGIDVDCSSNVLVEDSFLSVGDDVLCVKSGIDFLGRTFGRRSENITFRNIVAGTGHGITVGSETSAGVRNVSFINITMQGTGAGPRIKSQRGRGGVVEDITYRNVSMHNVDTAFQVTLNYHAGLPPMNASATPVLRNVLFDGVTSEGAKVLYYVDGLPESNITNITWKDTAGTKNGQVVGKCDFAQGACEGAVLPECPPCLG